MHFPAHITKAKFVEPMLLLAANKLPVGADWAYEPLCGRPHNTSSVAFGVMWRWDTGSAMMTHETVSDAT